MNDWGFGFDSDGLGFAAYAEPVHAPPGPTIPEARDCMRCGLCLSRCPTYQVRAEEHYGPRGRVRLLDRVLNQDAELADEERLALDACIQCGACEAVCPSKMAFSALYGQAMARTDVKPKPGLLIRLLLGPVAHGPRVQKALSFLIHCYQRSGLQWGLNALPFAALPGDVQRLDKLLPVPHAPQSFPRESFATGKPSRGKVGLFTGCLGSVLDTQTHHATVTLLTRLGFDACVIEGQTCCGAMHAHNGDRATAAAFATENIKAFSISGVDFVVHNASGCGAFFEEYPALLSGQDNKPDLQVLDSVTDVMGFLAETACTGDLPFRELDLKVAVHEPCSQRNVLQNESVIYTLLEKIPGLEVVPLEGNPICCGAGGTHMLTHAEFAEPLRKEKINALLASGADLLLSTNMTCALHLASGIRESGKAIEVMHPVRLLAQQVE